MTLWRQLERGLRVLTHRAETDRELEDEVEHYLAESVAEHVSRGLSPAAAERAARRELGRGPAAPAAVVEEVRAYGWENAVESVLADVRIALRRVHSSPGFAALVVLTVALGVGATAAIFSAVNPILLRALPYPEADRIQTVWERRDDGGRGFGNFGTFRELAERSRGFSDLAVLRPWQPTLLSDAEPERLDGVRVSAAFFRVLGVAPALGRDFAAAEDRLSGPRAAILADSLWRRRFAGDAGVLGRTVQLDGEDYRVVGILPRGFEDVLSPSAEIWTPLQYDMTLGSAWGHHLRTIGRLRPGVDPTTAARELDAIVAAPLVEKPPAAWAGVQHGLLVSSLQADLTRGVRPALLAVVGAVLLVLLLAAMNLTHLLLGRSAQRRGEFALRSALGAGRGRMIRQLVTEGLVLAVLGGFAGLAVAELGVRALVALSPPGLPRAGAIVLDGSALAFGLGLATLLGLAVGLAPALSATGGRAPSALRRSARRTIGGDGRLRGALVIAEMALALVLLVCAGLLLRSVDRLLGVEPGFDAAHVLSLQVQTAGHPLDDDDARRRFFAEALAAVRAVPGVTSAAWTSQLPLSGDADLYGVHFEGAGEDPGADPNGAYRYAVSPGYLETLHIPLRAGRRLDERDAAGAPGAVLINESFARRRFAGGDALGQRVHVGPPRGSGYEIVGVVGDVKQQSLAASTADAVYVPAAQWPFADHALWLVVRASGDAAALAPAVRRAIWSVDRNQPVVRVATMSERLTASAAERRFALVLFAAFAGVALLLAAIGVYGVLAAGVAERRRELGVRAALGASRGELLGMVLRHGLSLTAAGAALGLGGAWWASRGLASLLFGVSGSDPATYVGTLLLLLAVAAVACATPAWRAARVDPAVALRAD